LAHCVDMRPYHRVHVALSKREKQGLGEMLRKGRVSARVLRRALVLQQLDRGQTAAEVGLNLSLSSKAVRAIAVRFEQEGLEAALVERPRPGKQRLLDPGQSQQIVAMVCGPPPAGQARWSVRPIAAEAVRRQLVPQVGRETIRVLLEGHDLKPWREKNVVRREAR
jgi:transposase